MMRTLIVDDERLARVKLRNFLERHEDVEVIGECDGGASAITAIERDHPDVVFLDIQMPGIDGLEVVRKLDRLPQIVFVTAHDRFAVEAFELEAIDYLLKPFDRQRLAQTLERLRRRSAEEATTRLQTLLERFDRAGTSDQPFERFVVRSNGRMVLIDPEDVNWIEAEGNYARLHTEGRSPLIRAALSSLETQLESRGFRRIHRGILVNFSRVTEIQRGVGDDFVVLLSTGERLSMSRRYRARLKGLLG